MVTQYFIPGLIGGVETHVYELSVRLASRGHKVKVFTSTMGANNFMYTHPMTTEYNRIEVHYESDLFPTFHGLRIPKLHDVDVIHIHNYTRPLYYTTLLARRLKTKSAKLVVTTHGGLLGVRYIPTVLAKTLTFHDRLFAKRSLNNADKVIALCNFEKEFLVKNIGVLPQKIETIPNGVTIPPIFKEESQGYLKNLYGKEYLLTIARVDKVKNLDHVIKVLPELHGIHYVIAGQDFGELGKLFALAKHIGVENRVHYVGVVRGKNKYTLISNSLAFVLPSSFEMQPISLLEAMAWSKPVVASAVGGVPEIILHGINGFLYEHGDLRSLKKYLLNLIDDEQLRTKLGKKGREYILQRHDWNHVAKRIEELYEKTVFK